MLKIIKKLFSNQPFVDVNTMYKGLGRAKSELPRMNTVIDVGAAEGTWYTKAREFFPDAYFLLFEPLIERKKELDAIVAMNNKVKVYATALGDISEIVPFSVTDDLDGSGFYGSGNLRDVQVEKLDNIIDENNYTGPFLLKLDTHGYEVPILEGAKKMLTHTELIIIEVYGFHVAPNSLLFAELVTYLDTLGFRLFDINDIMRREKDQAFWQADAFFIKKSNKIFSNNSYK
jgi:FkbM family methyltransferase